MLVPGALAWVTVVFGCTVEPVAEGGVHSPCPEELTILTLVQEPGTLEICDIGQAETTCTVIEADEAGCRHDGTFTGVSCTWQVRGLVIVVDGAGGAQSVSLQRIPLDEEDSTLGVRRVRSRLMSQHCLVREVDFGLPEDPFRS